MHFTASISTFMGLSFLAQILATPLGNLLSVERGETIDGDDAVAYAWAVDAVDKKREIVDGDDAVAYAWAVDAEDK